MGAEQADVAFQCLVPALQVARSIAASATADVHGSLLCCTVLDYCKRSSAAGHHAGDGLEGPRPAASCPARLQAADEMSRSSYCCGPCLPSQRNGPPG